MSLAFPTLRELGMRAMLVNELLWKKEDEGLPMKKEMEALGWLPGNYTVAESSTEVIKAGVGVLNPEEARFAALCSLKKGDKISILKRIRGHPYVLWNIDAGARLTTPIRAQPLYYRCAPGSHGKKWATKITSRISGVVVENEACTGKVEVEGCFTREGKMVDKSSFCWQVNSMGKLEVAEKKWRRLLSGAEIEVICSAVAQRD